MTDVDPGQVAIPVGSMPPIDKRRCAWCGKPAVEERTVVAERKNAEKEIVKPAKTAPVCKAHSDMIDRNLEIASLWRRRPQRIKNLTHPEPKKAAVAKKELAEIEKRLLELGERLDRPMADAA